MAVDPLAKVTATWHARIAQAQQAGHDPTKVRQIAAQDWNNVKAGGKAMTRDQAWVSLQSVESGGANPLAKQRPTGLLGTLENIVPDMASTLWNLPKGVAHLVTHLPQEVAGTGQAISAASHASDLGGALRALDQPNSLLGLVPGVDVAAKLTTGQGRQELQQHPVGALLDVLPVISEGTAGLAKLADVGEFSAALDAAKATDAERLSTAQTAGESARPLSKRMLEHKAFDQIGDPTQKALLEGHLLKAGLNSIPHYTEARAGLLQKFGLDAESIGAQRQALASKMWGNRQLNGRLRDISKLFDGMTADEVKGLHEAATRPDLHPWDSLDETAKARLQLLEDHAAWVRNHGEAQGHLVSPVSILGERLTYANTGAGARIANGLERSATREQAISAARTTVQRVRDRFEGYAQAKDATAERFKQNAQAALDRHQPTIEAAQARLETIRTKHLARGVAAETQPEFMRAQAALDRATATRDQAAGRWVTKAQRYESQAQALRDHPTIAKSEAKVQAAVRKAQQGNTALMKDFIQTVPAQYVPQVESEIRSTIETHLGNTVPAPQLEQALKDWQTGGDMSRYFGSQQAFEKYFNQVRGEAQQTWTKLVRDGQHPVWVHSATETQLDRAFAPVHMDVRTMKPGQFRDIALDLAPSSQNLGALLSDSARQVIAMQAVEQFVTGHLASISRPYADIRAELLPQAEASVAKAGTFATTHSQLERMLQDGYTKLDSSLTGGLSTPRLKALYSEDRYIPKYVANSLKDLLNPDKPSKLSELNMGAIKVFKTSVLAFSPTHLLHIYLGGMMAKMLTGHLGDFAPSTVLEAMHWAHNPDFLPEGVSTSLDLMGPEEVMNYLQGKHVGRMLSEAGKATMFTRNLSEIGQNFYRAWTYLSEMKRGAAGGLDDSEAMARAMQLTNKAYVDINGLSPIERTAVKQVLPFYSFSRYAVQFVLQYPIDHPLRASILSNLSQIAAEDTQAHGLSNTLAAMFWFGSPDSKGDQWGMNLRAVNPYRDTASNFTKAGIFRALNPIARGALEASGFNTLDGAPDPYNGLAIDQNTGQLVAKPRSGGPIRFLEAFVPELGTVDHFLGLSGQLRTLKQTNPQAFRKQLFSTLNIPFVPMKTNLPKVQASAARRSLRVEQQDVASSWKNLTPISGYRQVSVPSTLKKFFGGRLWATPDEWNHTVAFFRNLKAKGVRRYAGITIP